MQVKTLLKSDCFPYLKPKSKKKNTTKKALISESTIQKQVERYLDYNGLKYIRLPDSLFRSIYSKQSIPLHVKAEIAKSIAGLPDLMIPKTVNNQTILLSIELKTSVGKMSQKQKLWQKSLGTKIARSFDEAEKLINKFLNE